MIAIFLIQFFLKKLGRATGVLQIPQVEGICTLFPDTSQGGDKTSEENGNVVSKKG